MTEGDRFINKCTNTKIDNVPWPHQIIKDTLHLPVFEKLKTQCEKIDIQHTDISHIYPKDYKKHYSYLISLRLHKIV